MLDFNGVGAAVVGGCRVSDFRRFSQTFCGGSTSGLAFTGSVVVGTPTLQLLEEALPATPTNWTVIADGCGVETGTGSPVVHVMARVLDPGNRIYRPAASRL